MKDKFSAERHSPSSPHLQAETHLRAGEGLDVTACSASLFAESLFVLLSKHLVKNKEWLTPEIGAWASLVDQQAQGSFDVREAYPEVMRAVQEL